MSESAKLLNFIARLPPNVNPYYATARKLEQSIMSPRSPPWSRRLRVVVLALYAIIFVQSLFLLYQRSKVHKSAKLKFNKLGLLVVNISDSSALAYFFYAPFTIFVISVEVALDRGYSVDESPMLCVFGHKFIAVVLGSWALLWVTACHTAQIFWDSDMASNMDREKLRIAIKWGLSTFFLVAAFGPLPFISWLFILAYKYLHEIESVVHGVASKLRAEGTAYDPETYKPFDLLRLLLPAQKLPDLVERLKLNLTVSSAIYCTIITLLIVIYIPLLTISLSALYSQSMSQAKINAVMRAAGDARPCRISRKIERERQRLVYHALCVFVSTAVHLPPTAWKVFHSKGDFLHDVTWKEVTHQGLMAPLAFTGNVILVILNMHSYQILADRKRKARRATMGGEPVLLKRTGIRTLFLSHTEDEEIALPDVEDGTVTVDDEKLNHGHLTSSLEGIKINQCTYSTTS